MKRNKALIMIAIMLVIASISLFGLVACDDKNNDGNGVDMVFAEDTTPEKIVEMIGNGEIKNYTLTVTGDGYGTTYYMGDKSFYGYHTTGEGEAYLMVILEDEMMYYLVLEGSNVTALKYAKDSSFYINYVDHMSFENERLVVDMLNSSTFENFTVEGNQIAWIYTEDRPNPLPETCKLSKVNNTHYDLPQELKNYKGIAVDGTDEW